jgi:hypothetical protein
MRHTDFSPGRTKLSPKNRRARAFQRLIVFDECLPAPKASGACIHCAERESILAVWGAEFHLDLMVAFLAKDVIINQGALLKIRDGDLQIMSVVGRF